MSWRMVEIECYNCREIVAWSWANWTNDPLLKDDPSSTLCDPCLCKLYPKTARKHLKPNPLEGKNEG